MHSSTWLRIAAGLTEFRLAASVTISFVVASSSGALCAQAGAQPLPPRVNVTELQAYVARFTGANPTDCGQHARIRELAPATAKDLQRSLMCASDAAKARKAFWTFEQDQGIDSLLFRGLLGTIDGIVYQFWYDSAPCGGPACSGRFSLSRCDNPTVLVHRNGTSDFGCDDVRRVIPNPLIRRSPIPNPETVIPAR